MHKIRRNMQCQINMPKYADKNLMYAIYVHNKPQQNMCIIRLKKAPQNA